MGAWSPTPLPSENERDDLIGIVGVVEEAISPFSHPSIDLIVIDGHQSTVDCPGSHDVLLDQPLIEEFHVRATTRQSVPEAGHVLLRPEFSGEQKDGYPQIGRASWRERVYSRRVEASVRR